MSQPRTNLNAAPQAPRAEKEYKKIGSIWEKKQYPGQFNAKADPFYGDLIFKYREVDHENQKFREVFYELKFISMFTPQVRDGKNPPAGLAYNLVIDLKNEESAKLLGAGEWEPLPTPPPDEAGDSGQNDQG